MKFGTINKYFKVIYLEWRSYIQLLSKTNIYEKNEIEVKDRRPREEVVVCICVNV